MKKILLNVCMLSLLVGLSYCGGKKEDKGTEKKDETASDKKEEVKKEDVKKEETKVESAESTASKLSADFRAKADAVKGKSFTVKGVVATRQVANDKGVKELQVLLKDKNDDKTGVFCKIPLPDGKDPAVKVGDMISVKGTVSGNFFDDPSMSDCKIVQ